MLKKKNIIRLVTILVTLIFFGAIVFWHIYTPMEHLSTQQPGADNRPEGPARSADDVIIGEFFMRYAEGSSTLTGQWPCFRGSDYKNIVHTSHLINYTSDFPVQWKVETGEGYAAPVIYNGRVYFLDYNEQLSSDALRCFDLETGTELWRRWYRVPMKRNHGFSRTVPVISDKYIITFGPEAHVMCCDPVTGDLKWTLNLKKQFESEVPGWYSGQCPRVEDNQLILAPAGTEILMIGVDCETGEILWQTPNSPAYKLSHSSVTPMVIHGKKTYVYAAEGGVCGVSGEVADRGKLLWNVAWKPSVIAPSPLQLPSGDILLTAGYGAGGALLQVKNADSRWSATLIDQYKANEGLSSEQQTPILYEQMVITVPPNDGGGRRGKLVAYSPSNIRTPIWESAADERFGYGPYMVIDNHLFALTNTAELYIYKLEQRSMTLVRKQRIAEGADAWGPLAYADGYLMVRDAEWVYCLKVD
ncbi:MAG: PQQ-like beta-propeller repeat protein [Tannerella sp.]|jgi:outer membrane protein assembly factor BamB|nr:PQQ-like beta-propeller repeat protein [Tannerella sp.]